MKFNQEKPLIWLGSSKKDLLALPDEIINIFGHALGMAQNGKKYGNAKALTGYSGAGVLEVIEEYKGDAYRAVYTVKFADFIFVLHVFQKKSKSGIETPKQDIFIINERLKKAEQTIKELKNE